MKLFISCLLVAMTCYPSHLHAQQWYDYMEDESLNYYEAVEKIEAYFKDRDKGKGSGYKQFKRWEYLMASHIDEKGNRISAEQEYKSYLEFMRQSEGRAEARTTASAWVELGPHAWTRTSSWSPGLGRIMSIAINPTNNNIIYVGTPGGGCWKTTDGGATGWTVLTDNFSSLQVSEVAIDPSNTNTVYIGCSANRLMKSTDGGTSWSNANTGLGGTVRRIIVHPSNSNIIITATSTGMYRSTNGGANWTLAVAGGFNDAEFKPGDPNTVYASGNSFYRSTNNGAAYTAITSGITATGRSFISVSPANANYVYMVMARGNEFGYLFRSTDSGVNFTTRVTGNTATGTNYFGYSTTGVDPGGQAGYDMAMCVSPTNAEEVHIGGIITWKSTNGGTSFVATTAWSLPNGIGYTHCDMHALEYVNGVIYSGSDGGIFKSTDFADNWINISPGLGVRQFYRIGCSKTDALRVTGGSQDNGTSIRNGTNLRTGWIDWLGADGMETFYDHTNANIVYGTSQFGTLYKSTNGGTTRTTLTAPASNGEWVTPFAIDPNVATTLYVGFVELYKSTNGGTSWNAITALGGANFTQLDIAPSNSNYIYASKGNTLYRTTNGGGAWTNVTIPSGNINYISVHPSNPLKVVIAASGSRVYTTNNGGNTWTNYTGTLPALGFNCAIYHNGPEDGIYLATTIGVYYRDNSLADWVAYSSNLPRVDVRELEIHYGTGKVRAGTYGRGLWETDLYTDPLPVYYSSFNAELSTDKKTVYVKWSTTSEINNSHFNIERSHNGKDFSVVGTVQGRGNSTQNTSYRFEDLSPLNGTSYYRLVQYDTDGTARYTNIASVYRDQFEYLVGLYPNPSHDEFNLLVSFPSNSLVRLDIINQLGATVYSDESFETNSIHKLGHALPAGLYHIIITGPAGTKTLQFVKQ